MKDFEIIYSQNFEKVCRICYKILGDFDLAREAAQDAFLALYKKHDHFRGEAKIETYLCRIAINKSINILNKEKRLGIFSQRESLCPEIPDTLDQAADVETKLVVQELLKSIGTKYRVPLILRELEGMAYNEIAEIMALPLNTVKSRIHEGRKKLKSALHKKGLTL